MTEIDDAIGQVSNLYRAVTGREAPTTDAPYAPIPAEKDPVQHVQEQMERLMGMLEPQASSGAPMTPIAFSPPLAVCESPHEVVLSFDLPGVSREHLEINVQSNVLMIAGQRPTPATNGAQLRTSERPTGPFRRAVPLYPGWKVEELRATLKDGVLEIRIPREAASGGVQRRIPIS